MKKIKSDGVAVLARQIGRCDPVGGKADRTQACARQVRSNRGEAMPSALVPAGPSPRCILCLD
jgi:hypothetical protein